MKWTAAEGFEVRCANYNGYEPCNTLKEHKPDARGYRADVELWCVGEAKTANDIDNDHTKAQFREFANRQMTDGKSKGIGCPFYIAIPESSEPVLKRVLAEIGLDNKAHVKWQAFEM